MPSDIAAKPLQPYTLHATAYCLLPTASSVYHSAEVGRGARTLVRSSLLLVAAAGDSRIALHAEAGRSYFLDPMLADRPKLPCTAKVVPRDIRLRPIHKSSPHYER